MRSSTILFISIFFTFILSQEEKELSSKGIYTLADKGYIMDINFTYNSSSLAKKNLNKNSVKHLLKLNKDGQEVFTDSREINLGPEWSQSNADYMDRFQLNVPSGNYSYELAVMADDKELLKETFELKIPEISQSTFTSSLNIFNSLKKWNNGNEIFKYFSYYEGDLSFNKNFVIGQNNAMFWYFEIYNLPKTDSLVNLTYSFYDESGTKVRDKKKTVPYKGIDLPVLDFYNVIAKLDNGKYRFEVQINVGEYNQSISDYISVYKQIEKPKDVIDYSMINLEVDQYLVMYRLKGNELDFFEELDDDAKLKYIKTYFTKLTEAQKITFQQLRNGIDQMSEFVNINYGGKFSNHLKSDMARLMFQYGQPSHIERVTSDPEFNDHEIWHYDNLINGVKFYLADPESLGMRIMHADHVRMGYWNPEWKGRIKKVKTSN